MTQFVYYGMLVLGGLAAALSAAALAGTRGLTKSEAFRFSLAGFFSGVLGAMAMAAIYNAVITLVSDGAPFEHSRVSLYGGLLFMPGLMWVFLRLQKRTYADVMDIVAPGVYVLLGFGKIGCTVYGCCYGIVCSFGVHTPFADGTRFPVQLAEAAFTFLLAGALSLALKKSRLPRGAVYPLGLTVYGVGRFFFQFLRAHPVAAEAALPLGLDFWQWTSLVAVVCGLAALIWTLMRGKNHGERSRQAEF
ncbi:MAG: prolipoprotein diacylglyceryl transferase [Clostridia bacterium]|nr:prolipoprotein diacylglyceryl transferase [Clostridia bacterium]